MIFYDWPTTNTFFVFVWKIISNEARVKTQWEKTIKGTARTFLDQIHRETDIERSIRSTEEPSAPESLINDPMLHAPKLSKLEKIKNDRRLLIKQKMEQSKMVALKKDST